MPSQLPNREHLAKVAMEHRPEWLALHNNYGGKDIKREQEAPDHKIKRVTGSQEAGLIWPSMQFELAENCMTCHGLAHPSLKADDLAKMLGAGHPINTDFELVKYSQGSVRHRHYPPGYQNQCRNDTSGAG